MQASNFSELNPEMEEDMLALKYSVDSSPFHTTMLCMRKGKYDYVTNELKHDGNQNYAVTDDTIIQSLLKKWFEINYPKQTQNNLIDNLVLTYNLDFVLQDHSETIGDIKKKLHNEKLDPRAVIWVFLDWECPLEVNQSTSMSSYDKYVDENLTQIETTFKFRSIAPHNSCYFYVKTLLKTTILQLKESIQNQLSFPSQKCTIKSKIPLDNQSFTLLIKKDVINNQKLQEIYTELKKNNTFFDPDTEELDFTNLDHCKIRDICPPGETIYIQFQDESIIEVAKGLEKHNEKKVRITSYERGDKKKVGAPSGESKIIEKKVIQRLFSQIKNLKVYTLLSEERIQNAMTTSVSCSRMTIKPGDTFQKFQNLILGSASTVVDLYTYPQNLLYYKDIKDFESISMEEIIDTLQTKSVLREDASSKCRAKREFNRQRVDPAFQAKDFLDPIVLYTSPYIYPAFNSKLRDSSISLIQKKKIHDELDTQWHYPFSEKLIKSLNRLPNYQGKVYRASSLYNYNYAIDQIIQWNCFTSTAKEFAISAKFLAGLLKSQKVQAAFELTYFFEIDTYSGKDIEMFSFFAQEKEVLLLPYSKFKVVSQGNATLWKQKIEVTWVHLVEIPIPKKIPGNIIVWIDANIFENSKAFNKIIQTNEYTNCDLIQLVSNEHFELWLQQFKQTLSLPGVNVQFITNMNRKPYFKQEGLKTLEMIRSFNKEAKVIFYIGNVARTREILNNYWEQQQISEDQNVEVVQSLKVLNNLFQMIMASQQESINQGNNF